MTNTSISLYLRLIISAIVLNLSFVKSAPVLVNSNSNNEIEEDAEYVPSDSFNYLVDYYCSPNKDLADLKLFIPEGTTCEEWNNDFDYWSQLCKCSIDSTLECPQCSETERSVDEGKIPHESELPTKYDSSSSHKNVPIHIPSPKLANLIIRKTHTEPETHSKQVRHGVSANSTNFIRFG